MKPITSPHEIDRLVTTYHEHLANTRGLAASTCLNRASHLREFLTVQWRAASGRLDLGRLQPACLVEYLTQQRERYQPVTLQSLASSLRSFFGFLTMRGDVPPQRVPVVPPIAARPPNGPTEFLSQDQLEQLVASLDPQRPVAARDRALVLCLAKLGLRAGEAARLRLEDLDWDQGTLRLVQTKGRRERLLPLPPVLGQALAHYLQGVRPRTDHRQVFVHLPEGKPLSAGDISRLTAAALRGIGCAFPRLGAQVLRRTFATHLAQSGASIKAIADVLGHRSLDTAMLYAQTNLAMLQSVAQPWPGACP